MTVDSAQRPIRAWPALVLLALTMAVGNVMLGVFSAVQEQADGWCAVAPLYETITFTVAAGRVVAAGQLGRDQPVDRLLHQQSARLAALLVPPPVEKLGPHQQNHENAAEAVRDGQVLLFVPGVHQWRPRRVAVAWHLCGVPARGGDASMMSAPQGSELRVR